MSHVAISFVLGTFSVFFVCLYVLLSCLWPFLLNSFSCKYYLYINVEACPPARWDK